MGQHILYRSASTHLITLPNRNTVSNRHSARVVPMMSAFFFQWRARLRFDRDRVHSRISARNQIITIANRFTAYARFAAAFGGCGCADGGRRQQRKTVINVFVRYVNERTHNAHCADCVRNLCCAYCARDTALSLSLGRASNERDN